MGSSSGGFSSPFSPPGPFSASEPVGRDRGARTPGWPGGFGGGGTQSPGCPRGMVVEGGTQIPGCPGHPEWGRRGGSPVRSSRAGGPSASGSRWPGPSSSSPFRGPSASLPSPGDGGISGTGGCGDGVGGWHHPGCLGTPIMTSPPTPYPQSDQRGTWRQWWGGDRDGERGDKDRGDRDRDRRGHRVRVGEEDREGTGTRTRTGE